MGRKREGERMEHEGEKRSWRTMKKKEEMVWKIRKGRCNKDENWKTVAKGKHDLG